MGQYISLHTHSEGSFLDGYSSVSMIVDRAVELGQGAAVVTDHGEVNQHMELRECARRAGIKPIYGMEGYLVDSVARVRAEKDPKNSHLCIWAETNQGLKNLWAWSTLAYAKNRYYKPLADWEFAREWHEGLIVSDGCLLSNMARFIIADDMDSALQWGSQFLDVFGENNFFMELHTFQIIDPQTEAQKKLNAEMTKMNLGKIEIAKQLSIPLIVVNDAHYAWEKDWENHALVWNMSTNPDQIEEHGKAASWIMGDDEVHYWMDRHGVPKEITQAAIENTAKIAERCNVEITPTQHYPSITGSDDKDLELYKKLVDEGFQRKVVEGGLDVELYQKRREEEDEQIIAKKFPGYFLVVADYCKWAKAQGMLVGPSRGSVGGSLIAWLLDIIEMDPVKHNLMFARFIDPGRKSFPDIDLDFPQSRRDEVKRYLAQKYGEDHVCVVGTLSRLQPRGILADLCRAMGISWDDNRAMSKIIEQVRDIDTANVEITWDEVLLEKGGDLTKWVEKYPRLFQKIGEMMGLIRQSSSHAGGVLISPDSLIGELPLRLKGSEGKEELVTQFEHKWVEELGFIKFDVLGIRHLDTLTEAWKMAHPDEEWHPNVFYNLPDEAFANPDIWIHPNNGHSLGIFQLEANSMESVTKDFKPTCLKDIKDLISVNRPGITRTGMLTEYIKRRHGEKEWGVVHPLLYDILAPTYGVVVYQEQVMKIVQVLAGYSLEESDKIRKIMGKMLYQEMKDHMPVFIRRCLENPEFQKQCPKEQSPEEVAYLVWKQIEAAGIYSFNEAHGMGYGLVTGWCVHTKYHHLREHLAGLMRTDPESIPAYLKEARQVGIPILPPDVNISENRFVLDPDGNIRYGLTQVKQVGDAAVADYLAKRPFTSLEDLLTRCSGNKGAKVNTVENLISIGAMDNLPAYHDEDGNEVWLDKAGMLRYVWDRRAKADSDFRKNTLPKKKVPDFNSNEAVYDIEVDLVGTFITQDPLGRYRDFLVNECITRESDYEATAIGSVFDIGGQLAKVKEYQARNGLMGFIKIDMDGEAMEVTCFADKYAECRAFLREGRPVIARVKRLEKGTQLLEIQRLDLAF